MPPRRSVASGRSRSCRLTLFLSRLQATGKQKKRWRNQGNSDPKCKQIRPRLAAEQSSAITAGHNDKCVISFDFPFRVSWDTRHSTSDLPPI
jgi:hypothetical protein